jgi:predicted HicB family RNase H-like nuclease
MTLMHHDDYIARVTYDEEIDSFFGEVINTSDVITFHGRSVEELKRELATSIEVHLARISHSG